MDEISWDIAKGEYILSLEQDEEIISFDDGLTYFWTSDIESMIEEKLKEEASYLEFFKNNKKKQLFLLFQIETLIKIFQKNLDNL